MNYVVPKLQYINSGNPEKDSFIELYEDDMNA